MNRALKITGFSLLGILFLCIFSIGYFLSTFDLLVSEKKMLISLNVPNRNFNIKVYHLAGAATDKDYVQIYQIFNSDSILVESIPGYSNIYKANYHANDTLEIIVKPFSGSKRDTVFIDFSSFK